MSDMESFHLETEHFLKLFLDVMKWFSHELTSSAMRYMPEIMLIWTTGLKLFHGRFLRFMSGHPCTCKTNIWILLRVSVFLAIAMTVTC